jgi:cytoplasmic iron level regulating protein YaaA (DUF328/UPF0246 family)
MAVGPGTTVHDRTVAGPSDVVVLLPPSEGKAAGGDGRWTARSGAFASLAARRREVVAAYASALDDPKVLGVKGPALERAQAAGRLLGRGRAPALPAAERFTGVVWQHLQPADLPVERIAIVSALLGACAGDDPVPDFRLKLSVSLPALGRLDRFWRPHVSTALRRWADGREVWDLLPNEHAAAVELAGAVRVRFEGVSGHDAKAAKGAFARHVLLTGGHARFRWHGCSATRSGDVVTVVVASPHG